MHKKHYVQNNLGYLIAMQQGAEIFVETNDDNLPYESFWQARKQIFENTKEIENNGCTNVYSKKV
jgi:hypothetical protein